MFEFLFHYPLTVFRKGEFVFASGWSGWLLLLAIAALGAGILWHLRRHPGRLGQRQLAGLGALQVAALALVLFMLWQPAIRIRSLRSQQNVVSLLIDTSRSMTLGSDQETRLDQVTALLEDGLLEKLREKFRVRIYSFSGDLKRISSLKNIEASGLSTRIGESVARLLGESAVVPLGAVVVFSDGSDNTGSFDRRLMSEIRRRRVPVHTVGVGRAEMPEDVELRGVNLAASALPRSQVTAQISIRHHGTSPIETRLTVRDDSRILASKPIILRPGETVQSETVVFNAGDAGVRNLQFLLDPVEGERIEGNNSLARVLDVPRQPRRVLYVEGEPRWEYKFMRRAIAKDENVRLVCMLRTTPNKFYRQGVDDRSELAKGFPSTPEELFAYDALILGSIEAAYFTTEQQEMIADFVGRRGGTLLMLAGRRGLADGGWAVSRIVDVLPVRLPENSEKTFIRARAHAELTNQGRNSLICRLDAEAAKNHEKWNQLPDLADYQRLGPLKPAAIPLLNARVGNETFPLLVVQNFGHGKAMILATGGTWRWKMQLPHEDTRHVTFWRQLVRGMVASSPGPVVLTADRRLYADEARVKLRAQVRDKQFKPAGNATVTTTITPESGDPFTIEMHPSAEEEGVFEGEYTATETGAYRAEVSAYVGEQSLGSDFLHFRREDGVAENFHPEQNRELLARLAGQTGGRYWTPADVAGLPGEIRFSEAGITAWETLDLWDMPILFFLLFALKGAEWLLRRHWGVV